MVTRYVLADTYDDVTMIPVGDPIKAAGADIVDKYGFDVGKTFNLTVSTNNSLHQSLPEGADTPIQFNVVNRSDGPTAWLQPDNITIVIPKDGLYNINFRGTYNGNFGHGNHIFSAGYQINGTPGFPMLYNSENSIVFISWSQVLPLVTGDSLIFTLYQTPGTGGTTVTMVSDGIAVPNLLSITRLGA